MADPKYEVVEHLITSKGVVKPGGPLPKGLPKAELQNAVKLGAVVELEDEEAEDTDIKSEKPNLP